MIFQNCDLSPVCGEIFAEDNKKCATTLDDAKYSFISRAVNKCNVGLLNGDIIECDRPTMSYFKQKLNDHLICIIRNIQA